MGLRLLVILSDPFTPLVQKGEVTMRYYNPGDFFSEVHFLLLNDDQPDLKALSYMSGRAKVVVHNFILPSRLNVKSLGGNLNLLRWQLKGALSEAYRAAPDAVRTFGISAELVIAGMIKEKLGIPHIASIHTNPHQPATKKDSLLKSFLRRQLDKMRAKMLSNADAVLPVYEPAVPFLNTLGVTNFRVCYNVLNPSEIQKKGDYAIKQNARIVCVSRQFETKDPSNIIRAVSKLSGVELTLIGDGDLHDDLVKLAEDLGVADRVKFIQGLDNDKLCRLLSSFDIFAVHSDHWEISKAVLEALLSGLPVVINGLPNYTIPELSDGLCVVVDNSEEGYLNAFERLIADRAERESLGTNAARIAWERWNPRDTEAIYRDVYQGLLAEKV